MTAFKVALSGDFRKADGNQLSDALAATKWRASSLLFLPVTLGASRKMPR